MKIIIDYIKAKLKLVFMLIICGGIFVWVFYLYNIPVEPVLYSIGISLFIILSFTVSDFLAFYKKYKTLLNVKSEVTISLENLPEEVNAIEASYRQLIEELFNSKNKLESKSMEDMTEMVDYYTLWVHQIKTPIAAMDLILQGVETKESKELKAQLFKIKQYVDMVLAYLRMSSETSDYVLREYKLEPIIKQCVRKYAFMFIKKRISIDLKQIDISVITDEKWLSFVIEQILSNSIKYTNKGKVSIYMDEEENLVISDTGIGIANEDLHRIFERGFTGYNGRMDKKASGLGLYLSKQILTKLGHGISIKSQVGEGTKVIISFNKAKTLFD